MSDTANPATTDTPQVLLEHHLKMHRLPTFLREYDEVARQCSDKSADFPRYLLLMAELEFLDCERRATERSSTLMTSNLPFQECTEVLGSERLTGALLDRLIHHVHILEMNGESYRLKQRKHKRNPQSGR
jgi:hypothetical protein